MCVIAYIFLCQAPVYICVGETEEHNHPSSTEHVYEEVGVAGEVKRSHNIQTYFNEAYGPMVKDSILTSGNSAYGQI